MASKRSASALRGDSAPESLLGSLPKAARVDNTSALGGSLDTVPVLAYEPAAPVPQAHVPVVEGPAGASAVRTARSC